MLVIVNTQHIHAFLLKTTMFVVTAFFPSARKHTKRALEDPTITNGFQNRTPGQHVVVNTQDTLFTPKDLPIEPQHARGAQGDTVTISSHERKRRRHNIFKAQQNANAVWVTHHSKFVELSTLRHIHRVGLSTVLSNLSSTTTRHSRRVFEDVNGACHSPG